jgi:predicted secreted protein
MKTRLLCIPCLTILTLALMACTVQPPTSTAPPPTHVRTITLNDHGKVITMTIGENILLYLGEGYNWTINLSNEDVIQRVKNITVIRGAQGIYDVVKAGTVTLTATGDPECLQTTPPCAAPSVQFTVTIVVQ